ncbi:MAG TPA: PspC domain-containing protein [Rugosimonospora sp.]
MTQVPTYKQLHRSRTDRMVGGVCGGLARYLGIDPVAVRVGYALVALISGGLALLAYPIMWIIMPDEPVARPWSTTPPTTSDYPPATSDRPPAPVA